jgi:hypothetical protein
MRENVAFDKNEDIFCAQFFLAGPAIYLTARQHLHPHSTPLTTWVG